MPRFYASHLPLWKMSPDDAIMGEEIFGPILPILTYESLDEAIQTVESHPHPLALYFFSEDKAAQKKVLDRCHFGGGCINDTIIHLATAMPFGGGRAKAAWADITDRPDLMSLHITEVLWIRRRGWICRCGIRGIISLRKMLRMFLK